ncbi:DsbA family oxidoreductase [Halobacterium yunchengense]|uniref:DsbA family oxidoreductase n=1 Tax=Halobacterium yunchengense TaxID=3108497 RepID=UPI00300B8D32
MSQVSPDTLTVFSDYVCPFCYLGRAAMDEYRERADDPPDVEWRVFDLRGHKRDADGSIDYDVDDGKDDDYFSEVRENVARLEDEYGVEMTLDFSRDVDSWDAQKLAVYLEQAHGEATFRQFHHATFDALWQDGRDVGDADVLVDLASDAGVPEDEARSALGDDRLDDELRARFEAARDLGVTGIPTFVYDGHAARGAIPPAQFERLVDGA